MPGTNNLLNAVPVDKVGEFEEMYLSILRKEYPDTLDQIKEKGQLTADGESKLKSLAVNWQVCIVKIIELMAANLKEVRNGSRVPVINAADYRSYEMVSAAKLRKARQAIIQMRPYSSKPHRYIGSCDRKSRWGMQRIEIS